MQTQKNMEANKQKYQYKFWVQNELTRGRSGGRIYRSYCYDPDGEEGKEVHKVKALVWGITLFKSHSNLVGYELMNGLIYPQPSPMEKEALVAGLTRQTR